MILDSRGRLFGRVNLLDLAALLFLLILASSIEYAFRVSSRQTLQVFSVEPRRIVAGSGAYAMMKGTGFDVNTTAWIGDYRGHQGKVFYDESTLGIEITEDYPPGIYRIIVQDGRGRYVTLPEAIEVIWVPQIFGVKLRNMYNTGEGARIEILGKSFTTPCSVRVGDRELEVVSVTKHQRIEAQLKEGSAPLPLGEQAVTVIDKGGRSATLERGVTVLLPPEVTSVEPSLVPFGEPVNLVLRGNHLENGTRVWIDKYLIGEARIVSSECLQIELKARWGLTGKDLILESPQGPKITVLKSALRVQNSPIVFMVMDIFPNADSQNGLESLQRLTAWRLRRSLRGLKPPKSIRKRGENLPAVEVVLPVSVVIGRGGRNLVYRGTPLSIGSKIVVIVKGQKLSGTIATEPFAVFTDDLLEGTPR